MGTEAKQKIIIKDTSIRTLYKDGVDFICITDIARLKNPIEPKDVVKNWLRAKNTIEYLGLWESLNNPLFKGDEFDPLLREAGSNIRDYATINQLICLSNMESLNAILIEDGVPQSERLIRLNKIAIHQMDILESNSQRSVLQ